MGKKMCITATRIFQQQCSITANATVWQIKEMAREKYDPVLSESSKTVVCRQTKHQKTYQLNNLSKELSSYSEHQKPSTIFPSQIKCSLSNLQIREHHLLNRSIHFAIGGFTLYYKLGSGSFKMQHLFISTTYCNGAAAKFQIYRIKMVTNSALQSKTCITCQH